MSALMIDVREEALTRGRETIARNLDRRVRKGRISEADRDEILERLFTTTSLESCAGVPFIVEAVVEDLEVKRQVFAELDRLAREDAVLATNTSSLSVARIASSTDHPERVAGMHFFNPVPAMRLVEVVRGPATAPEVVQKVAEVAKRLNKVPIQVSDTPGFVVNRVARPFYLEALKLVEAGGEPEQVDAAIRGAGFRMGPLELADLIGMDVNLAVSESLFERSYYQPRFRPSPLQRSMVEAGLLGRKTGQGFYKYDPPPDKKESTPEVAPGDITVAGDVELARTLGVEPDGSGIGILALRDEATAAGSGSEVGARTA
jgi:3-hydroxybutyryl-CoA dehydrogenase